LKQTDINQSLFYQEIKREGLQEGEPALMASSVDADEIVDFAEVEKFLDTQIKRSSSGMYVCLAFAVVVHLELEILLEITP
jgi:ABC-type polysaccharide/polyol phosphate transport system ATPase subunit